MPLSPLPPSVAVPFTTAHARTSGVSRSRTRASDLTRPFTGVRAAPIGPEATVEEQIRHLAAAYSVRMRPDDFFTHVTAAVIWGLPLPASALWVVEEPSGRRRPRPLEVGVIQPRRAPHSPRVTARAISAHLGSVRVHPGTGLWVTSPATTWATLGAVLGRDDLVAAGDALVRVPMRSGHPPPLATIDELRAAVDAGRRPGIARLREALPLVRERSMSRQETRLRLLLHDERMPEPELNHPVVGSGGQVLALIDAAYPRHLVGLEYEGEQHLVDSGQWAKDLLRYEALVAAGWIVIRVTKGDLRPAGRAALVDRVRSALRVRGA